MLVKNAMPSDVWDAFRVRLGSVRRNFGTKFLEPKIFNFKNFKFVRPSSLQPGPSSRRPEPRRPESPRRGGDGRTNRKFLRVILLKIPDLREKCIRYRRYVLLACMANFNCERPPSMCT